MNGIAAISRGLRQKVCSTCNKPYAAVLGESCAHCGKAFCGERCNRDHLCGGGLSCDDHIPAKLRVDIEAEHERRLLAREAEPVPLQRSEIMANVRLKAVNGERVEHFDKQAAAAEATGVSVASISHSTKTGAAVKGWTFTWVDEDGNVTQKRPPRSGNVASAQKRKPTPIVKSAAPVAISKPAPVMAPAVRMLADLASVGAELRNVCISVTEHGTTVSIESVRIAAAA